MVNIEIKHKHAHLVKVDKHSKIEELRKTFCKQNRIRLSCARFVYEGERIHVNDTPDSLCMRDGDVIEVFAMMTGGGRPKKGNIYGDSGKILDVLDSLPVPEDSVDSTSSDEDDEERKNSDDSNSSDENDEERKYSDDSNSSDEETKNSTKDKNIRFEEKRLPTETLSETGSDLIIQFVGNVGFNSSIEDMEILDKRKKAGIENISKEPESLFEMQTKLDQSETNIESSKFLSSLRKDYKDGKLTLLDLEQGIIC